MTKSNLKAILPAGRSNSEQLLVVRAAFTTFQTFYRETVNKLLCVIYAAALEHATSDELWLVLCQHADWKLFKGERPQAGDQEKSLKFVIRFSVGMAGDNTRKQCSKYHRALLPFFERKADVEEVRKALEDKGVEQLAREGVSRTTTTVPVTVSGQVNDQLRAYSDGTVVKAKLKLSKDALGAVCLEIFEIKAKKNTECVA
jgi:hypothetical protein